MANSNDSWPKFLKRMSASVTNDGTTTHETPPQAHSQQGPPLPRRPNQQLYQPQQWTEHSTSTASLSTGLHDISLSSGMQQPLASSAPEPQKTCHGAIVSKYASLATDDRPPTTDRVAEFILDIPDGIRNMTQHPGDVIVGSVVVTVTKPTKALRIKLTFLGQQRVYVRDMSNQASLLNYTNVDYTIFDKQLTLWGRDLGKDDTAANGPLETLQPGTMRVPFSIKIPRVNYPSSIKREKTCRVRYVIWATLERPGTFMDHTILTDKEEIHFEPIAYPTRPREALQINNTIYGTLETSTAHIAVVVTGGIVQLPAVAGDRVAYQLEARTQLDQRSVTNSGNQHLADINQCVIRFMRVYIVERLKARGLIKGMDHTQAYSKDIHAVTLIPTNSKPGKVSNSESVYSSNGHIRLPFDMCPFDSKQLERTYELRIECDVVDKSSLLDKMTRQKSTYTMHMPLEICTVSPDTFDAAAYQNAYTNESLNISSIALPPHHKAAAEPKVAVGGWELERSFIKWDRLNPTWVELARKRNTEYI
ncbi:hypothetical protein EV180_002818 [Coemansia sp. RSA 518]|nr:hypothetical protein EV181_002520 [Coemansia sp. RSA 532]KAJ2226692.1 hypothetical protein EV180_002818 [Coemansia sp. RSA 518]KAJ2255679.1 hypothetical protein GGH98_001893 [Coemansia sp. RSA 454]KAJ2279767.1 hypothetical protein GGH14_002621 [Coemansia sp. RSA 370]KAJ2289351.1 hypothetical protein IW141_003884 [Coemansia sp. RSA 355]